MQEMASKSPKKANLLDHHSIKHILDETASEIITSRGYVEDVRMSNLRLFMGAIIIIIALIAQFYNKKFPENRDFLIVCIVLYVVFNGILQLIIYTKEKNAILFTYPPKTLGIVERQYFNSKKAMCEFVMETVSFIRQGSYTTTGVIVSSKLPRFSDEYTLSIVSADPKSISAGKPVQFTKSVTQWFTKDGVLVEGLFWKDVETLINDYSAEPKKGK